MTSTSAPCPCPPKIKHLASTLPVQGSFDFSFLTTLTQPLDDLCKSMEGCRRPCHSASHSDNQDLNGPLVDLSDAVLSLCHAACTAYSLLDDELGPTATASGNGPPASHAAAPRTCAKSPMALGTLTLQAEEESLLARQVVSAVLTDLSVLLRDVYLRGKETAGGGLDLGMGAAASMGPALYGREGAGPVSRCLSGVLALLGRLFSE